MTEYLYLGKLSLKDNKVNLPCQ